MMLIEWDAASIFEDVLSRIHRRNPLQTPPRVDLQYKPFAGMNHRARLRDGVLIVGLSDLIRGADPRVIEALAFILLAKLYRRVVPAAMNARYREYILSRGMEQRILDTRRARGRKMSSGAAGACYNLTSLFAELNARYFGGSIPDVDLSWSRRATRIRLGHFDAAHRAIVISKSLDRADVPRLVVDYILYHEMLHVKHPVTVANGRRSIHTTEFRAEEKRFEGRAEARKLLRAVTLLPLRDAFT